VTTSCSGSPLRLSGVAVPHMSSSTLFFRHPTSTSAPTWPDEGRAPDSPLVGLFLKIKYACSFSHEASFGSRRPTLAFGFYLGPSLRRFRYGREYRRFLTPLMGKPCPVLVLARPSHLRIGQIVLRLSCAEIERVCVSPKRGGGSPKIEQVYVIIPPRLKSRVRFQSRLPLEGELRYHRFYSRFRQPVLVFPIPLPLAVLFSFLLFLHRGSVRTLGVVSHPNRWRLFFAFLPLSHCGRSPASRYVPGVLAQQHPAPWLKEAFEEPFWKGEIPPFTPHLLDEG